MTVLKNEAFSASEALQALLRAIRPLLAVDIGSRGEPLPELRPLASSVQAFGFEPDLKECERLNQDWGIRPRPFHGVEFFPVALAGEWGRRTLYITRQPGSSSLLRPRLEIGRDFCRPEYVEVVKELEVETETLDDFLAQAKIGPVDYLKIDCEGLELEILGAGQRLLDQELLALKIEASFLTTREGQPYIDALLCLLRQYGFFPLGFEEIHCWRPLSRRKFPKRGLGVIPFARGQLAHGDLLMVKDFSRVAARGPLPVARLALILTAFGYLDHAYSLLAEPGLKNLLKSCNFDVASELGRLSRDFERDYLKAELRALPKTAFDLAKRLMRSIA